MKGIQYLKSIHERNERIQYLKSIHERNSIFKIYP